MQIIRTGNGFELVYLTKKERKKALHELRKDNRKLFRSVFLETCKWNERNALELGTAEVTQIACSLFNACAERQFTRMKALETVKVFNEKEMAKAISASPKISSVEQ